MMKVVEVSLPARLVREHWCRQCLRALMVMTVGEFLALARRSGILARAIPNLERVQKKRGSAFELTFCAVCFEFAMLSEAGRP
jgi:hypothetical protein